MTENINQRKINAKPNYSILIWQILAQILIQEGLMCDMENSKT